MRVFVALLFALPLLVLGCSRGWVDAGGEFFSYHESDADGPVDPRVFAGGLPADLAQGPRTRAERSWIRQMNGECDRRNKKLDAIPGADGAVEVKIYADKSLDVLRDYRKRATAHKPPSSYTGEAEWVARVDAAIEEAVQDIFFATSGDEFDLASAVAALDRIFMDTRPGLLRIGLRGCAEMG